jgi:lipopolysaccharide/colanic/teichoic acid biosynthesis glycosyltransferase
MKRPLWKRPFDLVIGTALFIVLIPVMGLVAVLILIVDGPPVLFRQTRVGMGARLFTMVKFRTMRVGAEGDEPLNPDGSIANRRDDPSCRERSLSIRRDIRAGSKCGPG